MAIMTFDEIAARPRLRGPKRNYALHPVVKTLRSARQSRRLSMTEVADKMGYNRYTISRYERGIKSPKLQILTDWADALGMVIELRSRKEKS